MGPIEPLVESSRSTITRRVARLLAMLALPAAIAGAYLALVRGAPARDVPLVLSLSQGVALSTWLILHGVQRSSAVRLTLAVLAGVALGAAWKHLLLLVVWSVGPVVLLAVMLALCAGLLGIAVGVSAEGQAERLDVLSLSLATIAAILTYRMVAL